MALKLHGISDAFPRHIPADEGRLGLAESAPDHGWLGIDRESPDYGWPAGRGSYRAPTLPGRGGCREPPQESGSPFLALVALSLAIIAGGLAVALWMVTHAH